MKDSSVKAVAIITTMAVSWALSQLITRIKARKIAATQRQLYAERPEYEIVSPVDFPWVDAAYYDDIADRIATEGFRPVGDIEIVSVTRLMPGSRSFLRCFIGDQGAVSAACFHIPKPGRQISTRAIRKGARIAEFITEWEDGTFLVTSNAGGLNPFDSCPGITAHQHAPGTSVEELLRLHREQVQSMIAEADARAVQVTTLIELLAAQDRMHDLKAAYRQSVGYITRAEFRRIAGGKLTAQQMKLVRQFGAANRKQPKA